MAQLQATTVNGVLTDLRTENTTTSSRSLATTDRNKVVACTNSSDITITVPTDSVAFPIGSVVYIARFGSGAVTIAAGSGVTVTRVGDLGNFEELYVRKRASNYWVVVDVPKNPSGDGGSVTADGSATVHSFTSTGSATFTVS